jgi:D-3-phosphoglycerate dehydrogenase
MAFQDSIAADTIRSAGGMTILVQGALSASCLAELRSQYDVIEITEPTETLPNVVRRSVKIVVLRSPFRVTAQDIEEMPMLIGVIRAGSGTDNVALPALHARGIPFFNIPLSGSAVSEHAFGLLLSFARQIAPMHASLREGGWLKYQARGIGLAGKTALVVGFGRIGRQIARIAEGFAMRVIITDPRTDAKEKADALRTLQSARVLTLDEALPQSDVIFLSCPLTDSTRNTINAERLAKFRKAAILVNVARGGLVDHGALRAALEMGHLAGVCLDVFEREPPSGDPLLCDPRVVATPHIGAQTVEVMDMIGASVVETVNKLACSTHGF